MVKQGFKQTEAGIIPEDWDVCRLGDYSDVFRGGSPRPIQDYLTNAVDGLNWIKIGDVKVEDKYITSTQERIISQGLPKTREVRCGDLLLSNSMSFGRPYILKLNGCIHDGWLTIQNYDAEFNSDFLYYYLSSENVLSQYISMASGSGVKNLNKEKVAAVLVVKPKISEQEAIVAALSDIDELITNLEKLTTKKKAIKQCAMQELLTGKIRLAGFDRDWIDLKIGGNNGYLLRETIDPQCHKSTIFYEYSMPAFDEKKEPCKVHGADMHSNRTVVYGNVLLFNKLNVRQKRIWLINVTEQNCVCSSEFLAYCSNRIDLCFLSHLLSTQKITKDFIDISTGTSNSQKRISPKDFMDYIIHIPEDVHEQTAIAQILSDMDLEIKDLETKLEKYKLIKSGMMSELLTGRIRLIDKEED